MIGFLKKEAEYYGEKIVELVAGSNDYRSIKGRAHDALAILGYTAGIVILLTVIGLFVPLKLAYRALVAIAAIVLLALVVTVVIGFGVVAIVVALLFPGAAASLRKGADK